MVVTSFAIGVLGQSVFYCGFVDGILTVLFFNLLGVLTVCFFSIFGAEYGLRSNGGFPLLVRLVGCQMVSVDLSSRKIYDICANTDSTVALFNVLACIGWSAANSIVGAQLIVAVNSDVPGAVGIVIIAICTLVITFFGYKVVHAYEF